MIVKSYEIDEALQLTPVAPERIAEATQRGDARLWLDLVDFTVGELEGWLDELGVTVSVIKTRPLVRSRPWSKPESTLRRLRPDVPVVKTADTRQSEDPGGRGGPGLDWAAIW